MNRTLKFDNQHSLTSYAKQKEENFEKHAETLKIHFKKS